MPNPSLVHMICSKRHNVTDGESSSWGLCYQLSDLRMIFLSKPAPTIQPPANKVFIALPPSISSPPYSSVSAFLPPSTLSPFHPRSPWDPVTSHGPVGRTFHLLAQVTALGNPKGRTNVNKPFVSSLVTRRTQKSSLEVLRITLEMFRCPPKNAARCNIEQSFHQTPWMTYMFFWIYL